MEEETGFRVGRVVAHPTFGRGKIISIEGYGDNLRLEIMFTGLGVKKIMAKYARFAAARVALLVVVQPFEAQVDRWVRLRLVAVPDCRAPSM